MKSPIGRHRPAWRPATSCCSTDAPAGDVRRRRCRASRPPRPTRARSSTPHSADAQQVHRATSRSSRRMSRRCAGVTPAGHLPGHAQRFQRHADRGAGGRSSQSTTRRARRGPRRDPAPRRRALDRVPRSRAVTRTASGMRSAASSEAGAGRRRRRRSTPASHREPLVRGRSARARRPARSRTSTATTSSSPRRDGDAVPLHPRHRRGLGPATTTRRSSIGAQYFSAGAAAAGFDFQYDFLSPRDGDGHGSHTASTAAGNIDVAASVEGIDFGAISGVAPAAKVAAYKACYVGPDPLVTHRRHLRAERPARRDRRGRRRRRRRDQLLDRRRRGDQRARTGRHRVPQRGGGRHLRRR